MINMSDMYLEIEEAKAFMKRSIDKFYHLKETKRKNYQKIELKTCEDSPVFTELYIGGQKIEGVRSLELVHKAGDLPRLRLDINAMNLAIDEFCVCTAEGWGDFALKMIPPHSEEMEKGDL